MIQPRIACGLTLYTNGQGKQTVIAVGGADGNGSRYDATELFDIETETWTTGPNFPIVSCYDLFSSKFHSNVYHRKWDILPQLPSIMSLGFLEV